MKQITITVEQLSKTYHSLEKSAEQGFLQQTRFSDLPLPARLLLAVPRVRGTAPTAQLAERYILDTLGRIIDAGPERQNTIEAVNLLSEVLTTPSPFSIKPEKTDNQWLTAMENLVLCVLCKLRSGQTEQANQLTQHWLSKNSIYDFNTAASTLCNSKCFKRGGPNVFTSGCTEPTPLGPTAMHHSVTQTDQLLVGESLLIYAVRLRMRTLNYTGINARVLPMMGEHLALPKLSALIDAHLMESLQFSKGALDIGCLCRKQISRDEARLLAAFAAIPVGDDTKITNQLSTWLPDESVNRLKLRSTEFQTIVQQLGNTLPLRNWNFQKLSNHDSQQPPCQHLGEPPIFH